MANQPDTNQGQVSEWNQQYTFDYAFHNLSWKAKLAQQNQDVVAWCSILESLYVHVDAILGDDERNVLSEKLNGIRTQMNEYKIQKANHSPELSEMLGKIYVSLIDFEIHLRRFFNKHNAFLKLKEEADFSDF